MLDPSVDGRSKSASSLVAQVCDATAAAALEIAADRLIGAVVDDNELGITGNAPIQRLPKERQMATPIEYWNDHAPRHGSHARFDNFQLSGL
jgi:hypothetical protein